MRSKSYAIFRGLEGKPFIFDLELYDRAGLAGNGVCTRAIVRIESPVQGATNK